MISWVLSYIKWCLGWLTLNDLDYVGDEVENGENGRRDRETGEERW